MPNRASSSGFDPDPEPVSEDVVPGAVSVQIVRRTARGERTPAPLHLGLDEAVVVGRPDERLAGGAEFVPWPGDSSDRTLPRQAVRIELLLGMVRFTLAESFRALARGAAIEVRVGDERLDREALQRAAHEVPVQRVGDQALLEIRRRSGTGEQEQVRFEVRVRYAATVGGRTLLATDTGFEAAVDALRGRWWAAIVDRQAGAVVLAAVRLARTADSPVTARMIATSAGRTDGSRPDQAISSAVRTLFEARRGDPVVWDAHLRILDLAHLYTDDDVWPENDGAREYGRFGDAERFVRLVDRLVEVGVLSAGR